MTYEPTMDACPLLQGDAQTHEDHETHEVHLVSATRTSSASSDGLQGKLAAKFGADLLVDGFDAIPKLIKRRCRQVGMTPTECFLMEIIWSYWYEASELPWPSVETLSRVMMKSTRQVQRYLVRLQEKGFLQIIPRYNAHQVQITNLYDFSPLLARIGEAALAEKETHADTSSYNGKTRAAKSSRGKAGRVTSSSHPLDERGRVTVSPERAAHEVTSIEPARVTSLPDCTNQGRVTSLPHCADPHSVTIIEPTRVTALPDCTEQGRVTSLPHISALHDVAPVDQGRVTALTEEAALELDSSCSYPSPFLAPPTEMTATLAAEMAPEQESKQEENKKDIYSNLELVFSDGSFYLTTKDVSTTGQVAEGEAHRDAPIISATFLSSSLQQTESVAHTDYYKKNESTWEADTSGVGTQPDTPMLSTSVEAYHNEYLGGVEAYIDDFSREFHDESPRASRTRVARMAAVAQEAGMYEQDFIALLYDLRQVTWEANVTKRTRDGRHVNRMPYFLHLLEQELAAVLAQWGLDYEAMRYGAECG